MRLMLWTLARYSQQHTGETGGVGSAVAPPLRVQTACDVNFGRRSCRFADRRSPLPKPSCSRQGLRQITAKVLHLGKAGIRLGIQFSCATEDPAVSRFWRVCRICGRVPRGEEKTRRWGTGGFPPTGKRFRHRLDKRCLVLALADVAE